MTEYLKPFFENKCSACQKYDCVNTKLFNAVSRQSLEKRGIGRIRYNQGLSMAEHELPIQDCPTRKIIENRRKRVGGFGWQLIEGATIRVALRKLDKPLGEDSVSEVSIDSKVPPEK
jgi:hypothetical protein